MAINLAKSVRALSAQKQALLKREQQLLAELNAALPQIGYRVVPVTDGRLVHPPARPPRFYACPVCDRTFPLVRRLRRHMRLRHRVVGFSRGLGLDSRVDRTTAKLLKELRRKRKAAEATQFEPYRKKGHEPVGFVSLSPRGAQTITGNRTGRPAPASYWSFGTFY